MVDVTFRRVTALPLTPQANTLYFVKPNGAAVLTLYSTGTDAVPLPVGSVTAGLVAGANVTLTTLTNGRTQIDATAGGGGGGGDMYKSQNLGGLADYSVARSNLGLIIGTNVQAYSSVLAAFVASAGNAPSATVAGSAPDTATPRLAVANNLSDLASAVTARSNLGLGTLATQSGTFSGTSSGTNTGDQTNITGNAGTATKLAVGRTIALTGDVAYTSPAFDGSGNVTAAATLAATAVTPGSYTYASITVDAKGRLTAASSGAAPGGSGTVTTVSVVSANGVSGSVANATTTPAITLSLGAITPTSVAATGAVSGSNLSGTNTGDQTSVTGNAGTATKLATARTINGVSFDGTANITLPTAAVTDIDYGVNFTAAGDAYVPARVAMTLAQGNAPIGTGTLAYAASTSAAPSTFTTTTLPVTLQAGAWLKVSASAVTGFVAVDLYRTA